MLKISQVKTIVSLIITGTLLTTLAFTLVDAENWEIGKDYAIHFSGKLAKGGFTDLKGIIVFDSANLPGSKFDVNVDVASINTGIGLKNKHARSDKWFDAEKYPVIHFVSSKITRSANGYDVEGDLEMHGIKQPISFPFNFSGTDSAGLFTGSFEVDRNLYHIGKAGKEPDLIKIELSVPVTAQKADQRLLERQ